VLFVFDRVCRARAGRSLKQSHGVIYELPWIADPNDVMAVAVEFLKAGTTTGIKWSNGTHTFEVANGEVRLNGKRYGMVKPGDRLTLTEGGVVSVNGVERKPDTEAEAGAAAARPRV